MTDEKVNRSRLKINGQTNQILIRLQVIPDTLKKINNSERVI